MSDPDKTFLFDLLHAPSPSGWETRGQHVWMERMRPLADSVASDAYGNAWATRSGAGDFRLMLEAHADEIGFIVKHIDEKGFLTLAPIGGSDRTLAPARRVRIFGDLGEVTAIVGNTAIHLRDKEKDKQPEWKDLFADVGAKTAAEARALGIRVGHPGIYADGAEELSSGRVVGRALDNRIGGYLLARVFAELAAVERSPAAGVIAVNAVQEEVGSQGARMMAHRLAPDAALVFDVTHATDVPSINAKEHGFVALGGGPAVAHGGPNHPLVVRRLLEVAAAEGIAVQHEAISRSSRTDTDVIYTAREGIPSALVSIPLRYMHSPTEVVDLADVEAAVRLVTGFVRSLEPGENFRVFAAG